MTRLREKSGRLLLSDSAVCSLLVTGIDIHKTSCNSGDPIFYNSLQFSSLSEYPYAGIGSVLPGINADMSNSQGSTRIILIV